MKMRKNGDTYTGKEARDLVPELFPLRKAI